jgi:dihydroneopterin aldolase
MARGLRDKSVAGTVTSGDTIFLEGIQVPAALGVTVAERRMRRPVLLDLEIGCDLRAAGRSDQIRHTLQYERVFEVIEDVAGNQEHKLVEALGQRIVDAVFSKFDPEWVTVWVRKPKPIAGVLDYAGIRITRRRGEGQ